MNSPSYKYLLLPLVCLALCFFSPAYGQVKPYSMYPFGSYPTKGKMPILQFNEFSHRRHIEAHIKGAVKSISFKVFTLDSIKGKSRKLLSESGSYLFTKKGHLTEVFCYDSKGRLRNQEKFKYDFEGAIIPTAINKAVRANTDKISDEKIIDGFDEKGNHTRHTVLLADSFVSYAYIAKYDTAGNCIQNGMYDLNDSLTGNNFIFKYDHDGRCIEMEDYSHGKLDGRFRWKYDSLGNELERIMCEHFPVIDAAGSIFHQYVYDNRGNIIKQTDYKLRDDGVKVAAEIWEATYEYY